MPIDLICNTCKKKYSVIPSEANKSKYCCKECANIGKRTGHNIICDNCGKEFYRRKYHIDRQNNRQQNSFCCQKCRSEYKHKQSIENRICPICNKSFECSKTSTQKFCCRKCVNEYQKTLIGELNSAYNRIEVTCDYCGKKYKIKPYCINTRNHYFCSVSCRQKWYAEIYSQTEEYKNKCRIRASNLLKINSQSKNTLPQKIINSLLDSLNILYENEKVYDYYSVDNYLIDYDLIIEVMGDYWHSNPIKYTMDKLNNMQMDRIYKDKIKFEFIKNVYNINILYLWEEDIKHNILLCQKLIEMYIMNNGILNNYHSFNYSIVDDNLLLNENIISQL